MAEAVAGLATAASALQVTDLGLRWGKEIYDLLSDIRHAPQEVQSLRNAVNDVNSVIGDLKRYIEDFKKTASTRAGHGVLPVIVTQAVQEFHDEVALIEVLSPPSSHRQNLRWGLGRKRKAKEATEKLEKRKTTLPLALQVFGSWADIGIRDDIRNLSDTVRTTSQAAKDSNASSFSTVTSDLATIRGSGQRIEASQAQSHNLLQGIGDHASSLSTVTSDLARIRDSGQRIEASQAQSHNLLQGIGDHASSLSTVTSDLATIRGSGQRNEASQAQCHSLLQGISNRLPQAHGATHEKLDYIISLITGLQVSPTQSLSTTSASNLGSEELLVTFFRAELRRVLIPALEQSLVPFSEKEAILQTIERGVDLISAQMSEAATFRKPAACEEEQTQPPSASPVCTKSTDASKSNSSSGTSTSDHIVTPERDPEFSRSSGQRSKGRAPAKLVDRVWRINCRIGYLVTRFQRFRRRDDFSGHDPFFRISVMFYPSSRLITLPGLSVYFTDECDHRGHYQLCPLLATFPIISDHAPVWEYIEADDVEGVRNLFVAGLASPNDQNSRGGGLLTVAASNPSIDMCRFLLEAGSDPASSDVYGLTAFEITMFYTVVFEPPTDSVDYKRCRLIAVDHAEQVNLLWNASVHDLDYTVSILLPLFMPHIPYTLDFKREFLSTLTFELRQQLLLIMPLKIICSSFEPTPAHVRFLEFLLSCGFNPNNKSEGLVLLEIVLFYLAMAKNEQEVGGWISHLRSIVTLLLRKGADPHIPVEAFGVDQTMTSLAVELGLLEEWARALSESGYDPMEVYVESERRLKEEKMFQGAKPSAVDMAELLPPSKIMERRSGHVFEEE